MTLPMSRALEIALAMQRRGVLQPNDAGMIEDLNKRVSH